MDERLKKYGKTSDALHYMSTDNLTRLILSNVAHGRSYECDMYLKRVLF